MKHVRFLALLIPLTLTTSAHASAYTISSNDDGGGNLYSRHGSGHSDDQAGNGNDNYHRHCWLRRADSQNVGAVQWRARIEL